MDIISVLDKLKKVKRSGSGYVACCPAHEDKNQSLSVKASEEGKILLYCHAGCSLDMVLKSLGMAITDLFPGSNISTSPKAKREITAIYEYLDGNHNILFRVIRTEPKGFYQQRPNGHGGWTNGLGNINPVPYRLPEVLKAIVEEKTVFFVEGEKDVDNLRKLGLVATTSPMGAGKWQNSYCSYFLNAHIVILPDNDEPGKQHAEKIARSLFELAKSVKILELTGLPVKGDVSDWLASGGSKEQLEELAKKTPLWNPQPRIAVPTPYSVSDGCLSYEKTTREGPVTVALCNFTANIVSEETRDDGLETSTLFTIKGTLANKKPLPTVQVPAEKFASMNWVSKEWGSRAIVYAGNAVKDHIRVAIQVLSGTVQRKNIFTHVGWRKIEDQWLYLHGGGAIHKNGSMKDIETALEGSLSHYLLPELTTETDLRHAVKSSLEFLQLNSPQITYPLLASIYRAPLGEVAPIDFSVFLAGTTGSQKSELSAMAQAHFGVNFNGRNLPGSWASSANSLEKQSFLTKDAIFVIDDFCPAGGATEVQRLHREADRLLRGTGNRAGRGRMNADGSLRASYFSRGLIISTGEDIPKGQSLRARLLILEIGRGSVNLQALTQLQKHAINGTLATAMSGFIKWLAPQMDKLKKSIPEQLIDLRAEWRNQGLHKGSHDRLPDIAANLTVGFNLFLAFALQVNAISYKEMQNHSTRHTTAIMSLAATQSEYQLGEEPTTQFIDLLQASLVAGLAHIANAKTNMHPDDNQSLLGWRKDYYEWQPQGIRIGWIDNEDLFLEPEAAFVIVQKMAREQGTTLTIGAKTLWKRMVERSLVVSADTNRSTIKKYICSAYKRVLHTRSDMLFEKNGTSANNKPPTSTSPIILTEFLKK